jgi:hypothetical protein
MNNRCNRDQMVVSLTNKKLRHRPVGATCSMSVFARSRPCPPASECCHSIKTHNLSICDLYADKIGFLDRSSCSASRPPPQSEAAYLRTDVLASPWGDHRFRSFITTLSKSKRTVNVHDVGHIHMARVTGSIFILLQTAQPW